MYTIEVNTTREILSGVTIHPQILETACGKVEVDLTEGDGPVVVASHAGFGGVDQARLMLNWLAPAHYRLLSPSRPGYLGTPLASGQSFEEQADLFAALLDTLRIEKVAVVSLSAGGPPGYQFAMRHPDRVWALIAIASVSGFYTMPETANPVVQSIFMSRWGTSLMQMIGQKKPAWLLRGVFQSLGDYTKQQTQAHIDFVLRSPEALAFAQTFMAMLKPYKPRLPGTNNDTILLQQLTHMPLQKVGCPTLIVHGTHDADVKLEHGVYAYENIPAAEQFWIEEGSHLGFWLSPHAVQAQATAREFLHRHQP